MASWFCMTLPGISIVGFMVGFLISSHLFKYQSMRRENQELKTKMPSLKRWMRTNFLTRWVMWTPAAYIHPAAHDMRPGVRLSVIIERFGQITGAMLEGQYNRKINGCNLTPDSWSSKDALKT